MAPDSSTLNSTHIFACIPAISVAACRLLFRQKRDSNRKAAPDARQTMLLIRKILRPFRLCCIQYRELSSCLVLLP